MASVEESLYAKLASDTAVTTLVGTRIYPGDIPDHEVPTPWVRYLVKEWSPLTKLGGGGTGRDGLSFDFEVLATSYAQGRAICQALKLSLDEWRGGQVDGAFWEGSSHEDIEGGHLFTVKFIVKGIAANIVPTASSLAKITTANNLIGFAPSGGADVVTVTPSGMNVDGAFTVNGKALEGITDHSKLSNLSFGSSGHTGFAGTGVANTFSQPQTFNNTITINASVSIDGSLTVGDEIIVGGVSLTANHAELQNLSFATSGHTGFAGTGVANTFTQAQSFIGGFSADGYKGDIILRPLPEISGGTGDTTIKIYAGQGNTPMGFRFQDHPSAGYTWDIVHFAHSSYGGFYCGGYGSNGYRGRPKLIIDYNGLEIRSHVGQTNPALYTWDTTNALAFAVMPNGQLRTNQFNSAAEMYDYDGMGGVPLHDSSGTLLGYLPILQRKN